ncbi:MAG: 3-phenylpropionate/cinnamic acid dioxygenase subunit beta [Bdellovibrionales bacterium]|nr:3-phenylpropionate/cinnamic acid dioxygenase subunit beta [Ramlibacter sp.]
MDTTTLPPPTASVASEAPAPTLVRDLRYFQLRQEVEEFLYEEAELLDQRRYLEWLDTLAEDLVYFMPMKRNVKFGRHAQQEDTRFEKDMSWMNEGKWTLRKRAEQILTGVHWAEEPLSRVCHMVSNVQLTAIEDATPGAERLKVRSRFLIYQNRVEYEQYFFVGKRNDVLRREGGRWLLERREICLDQNVLLAKNLTVFF